MCIRGSNGHASPGKIWGDFGNCMCDKRDLTSRRDLTGHWLSAGHAVL